MLITKFSSTSTIKICIFEFKIVSKRFYRLFSFVLLQFLTFDRHNFILC